MSAPAFIAGDWGTSHLRLALCDAAGVALDSRDGPGAAAARGRFAAVYDELSADWRATCGVLPAVLCGMAGSTLGWIEVPYLPCPADLDELTEQPRQARIGVHVIAGLRCSNPLGAPDLMRGEETQLLGARELEPRIAASRQLVCMPGTHTKWVSLHDGVVQEFLTVPSGEIFALLCDHSVLVRDAATPVEWRDAEYERGLAESARHPEVPLLHRLFQARSLRLDGQLAVEGAASWMSGLLIGTDVLGALPLFANHGGSTSVFVVGATRLTELYARALARHGRTAIQLDGSVAALRGLAYVQRALAAA